jgi:hypothetical protein
MGYRKAERYVIRRSSEIGKVSVVWSRGRQGLIELRRLRDIGEEQREGVLVDVFGQLVEDLF